MPFISKKKHDDYCKAVNSLTVIFENAIARPGADEQLSLLRKEVGTLNTIHADYLARLTEMQELIKEYFVTQKKIRTSLKHMKGMGIKCHN